MNNLDETIHKVINEGRFNTELNVNDVLKALQYASKQGIKTFTVLDDGHTFISKKDGNFILYSLENQQ